MIMKMEKLIPKLLCLAVITAIAAATTSFSRFESVTTGMSEIEVAAFIIDASGENEKPVIDLNDGKTTDSYRIEVTNQKDHKVSGVSMEYDIELVFTPDLPAGMTITDGTTILYKEDGTSTYILKKAGTFNAGIGSSNIHTITIIRDSEDLEEYCGEMSIYVAATQIDERE